MKKIRSKKGYIERRLEQEQVERNLSTNALEYAFKLMDERKDKQPVITTTNTNNPITITIDEHQIDEPILCPFVQVID